MSVMVGEGVHADDYVGGNGRAYASPACACRARRGTGAVRGVLREEAVKAGALKIDFCV